MKILLADDHELIREGFSRILSEEFPSVLVKEASNGNEAEKIACLEEWDIIIMDMSMPFKTGLDVLKQLRLKSIKTPVLICSIHPENQYALRILKAGGNGYISKDCSRSEFITAIKSIINGKKYISASVTETLALNFSNDINKEQYELLSDRELEVLKLIASGNSVSEIAEALRLSVTTISTYRGRLLEKMNLKNNAELTHYAINNKLV